MLHNYGVPFWHKVTELSDQNGTVLLVLPSWYNSSTETGVCSLFIVNLKENQIKKKYILISVRNMYRLADNCDYM